MRLLCESMLAPSSENWLDLLRAADLLGSRSLALSVIAFLRDRPSPTIQPNLPQPAESSSQGDNNDDELLRGEFPGLLEHIAVLRSTHNPRPPQAWLLEEASRLRSENEQKLQRKAETKAFPLWALLLAVVCLVLYKYISNVMVIGPYVYVINVSSIFVGFLVFYYSLKQY